MRQNNTHQGKWVLTIILIELKKWLVGRTWWMMMMMFSVMSQLQVHHMRTSSNKQFFHQIDIIYYENMKNIWRRCALFQGVFLVFTFCNQFHVTPDYNQWELIFIDKLLQFTTTAAGYYDLKETLLLGLGQRDLIEDWREHGADDQRLDLDLHWPGDDLI